MYLFWVLGLNLYRCMFLHHTYYQCPSNLLLSFIELPISSTPTFPFWLPQSCNLMSRDYIGLLLTNPVFCFPFIHIYVRLSSIHLLSFAHVAINGKIWSIFISDYFVCMCTHMYIHNFPDLLLCIWVFRPLAIINMTAMNIGMCPSN